ncbi:MAG TPA: PAS domain S-box protein [Candidatus Binatia bacterium]
MMKPFQLSRLRHRLILLVSIATIPALGLILYDAWNDRVQQTREIERSVERLARFFANEQLRIMESARQLLIALAQLREVRQRDTRACSALFAELDAHYSLYANFGAVDPDGTVFCSSVPARGSINVSERAYFNRALETREFAVGEYQIGRATGKAMLNFGYPVLNEKGNVQAIVFVALDLGWLNNRIAELSPSETAVILLDAKGTILARDPEPERWVGKSVPETPLFRTVAARAESVHETVDLDGITRLYSFSTVSPGAQAGKLYVAVGMPMQSTLANVNRSLARNLAWLGLVAAMALVAAWLIGDRFIVDYVNERVRAEEALAKLGAVVESSDDAIIGESLDGTITSWNSGAKQIYGYAAEEVVGRPISVLIPTDHAAEVREILDRLKRGEHIVPYETVHRTKAGKRIFVSLTISPIMGEAGRILAVSTIARNITERKGIEEQLRASEERFRALAQTANDAIISADTDGNITYFNRGAEEMFGYAANSMVGRPLAALMPDNFRSAHEEGLKRLVTTGEARLVGKTVELAGKRSDGKEFPMELSLASWKAGASTFFTAIIRDITRRKRAEQRQADFTAMIAHDLRSPLMTVVSATDILKDGLVGSVNQAQRKWLDTIQAQAHSLVNLVGDFLDLSKLEAGRIDLIKEKVDLEELIKTSADHYVILAEEKKITLRSRVEPTLARIEADPRRLNQVLGNLLSNAIKFTLAGGDIEIGAGSENGAEVKLWVKDNGVGIPAAEIGQLFEKYRQTTSGKFSAQKGTGLGLVICKMIVETHGGKIWVESEDNSGATFFFTLPRA